MRQATRASLPGDFGSPATESFWTVRSPRALPATSVVVPTHNRIDLVRRCLASIPAWAEVVLVDDGSREDVKALVEAERPGTLYLRHDKAEGFASSANAGLRIAAGTVRVVLNSDARLLPGSLEQLVGVFEDERIGIAGCRLLFPDGSHQTSAARFLTPVRLLAGSFALNELYRAVFPRSRFALELGLARRDHYADFDVDWVVGACLAIRDTCLADIGGYDTAFPFYVEETDLCWRAWQKGWRVRYVSSAPVVHEGGASSPDVARLAASLLDGEELFMRRTKGGRAVVSWWLSRMVGGMLKAALFGMIAPLDPRIARHAKWQRSSIIHLARRASSIFGQVLHPLAQEPR